MKTALVVLAESFESVEAVTPIDILTRAGIKVTTAAVGGSVVEGKTVVKSGQGLSVVCDKSFSEAKDEVYDVIICPGGMPAAETLGTNADVVKACKKQIDDGRFLAAICAAPAQVLGRNKLLPTGAKSSGYPDPSLDKFLGDAKISDPVHLDKTHRIVTARGPADAALFSFAICEALGVATDPIMSGMKYQ